MRTPTHPARPQALAAVGGVLLLVSLLAIGCYVARTGHAGSAPFGPPAAANPAAAGSWQFIVVHHSATARGNAAIFDKWHREQNHWRSLGYHFVIGNGTDSADGLIEVGPRWTEQSAGAHCGGTTGWFNKHGIGICLVGNFEEKPPTAAQLASLRYLLRKLCRDHSVPPGNILGHREAALRDGESPNRVTLCPGRLLDMNAVRRMAQ